MANFLGLALLQCQLLFIPLYYSHLTDVEDGFVQCSQNNSTCTIANFIEYKICDRKSAMVDKPPKGIQQEGCRSETVGKCRTYYPTTYGFTCDGKTYPAFCGQAIKNSQGPSSGYIGDMCGSNEGKYFYFSLYDFTEIQLQKPIAVDLSKFFVPMNSTISMITNTHTILYICPRKSKSYYILKYEYGGQTISQRTDLNCKHTSVQIIVVNPEIMCRQPSNLKLTYHFFTKDFLNDWAAETIVHFVWKAITLELNSLNYPGTYGKEWQLLSCTTPSNRTQRIEYKWFHNDKEVNNVSSDGAIYNATSRGKYFCSSKICFTYPKNSDCIKARSKEVWI